MVSEEVVIAWFQHMYTYGKRNQAAFYSSMLTINTRSSVHLRGPECYFHLRDSRISHPGPWGDPSASLAAAGGMWGCTRPCPVVLPASLGVTACAVLALSLFPAGHSLKDIINMPGVHGADRSMGNTYHSVAAVRKQVKYCRVAEKTLNYQVWTAGSCLMARADK